MNKLNQRQIFIYLTAAALLFVAGWFAHDAYLRRTPIKSNRNVVLKGFRFTSPLLDVELPEGIVIGNEPIPFKYKIKSFTQNLIDKGQVRAISVYYRDLHDGPWFGINEKAEFNPASMMKVPVMVAWLKRAEKDPNVLNLKFIYNGEYDMSKIQNISPEHTIVKNKGYTVKELLYYMMRYSDNNATSVLYYNLKGEELDTVLDSMDINNNPKDGVNSITVHGYSGFFRILYNASFLNREMSEKALELLSEQEFSNGIVAGVPKGTVVAAKFGAYSDGMNSDKQLHEFGIIYHPTSPYILGIMTTGDDFSRQANIISDISRLIYKEVNSAPLIRR
ncbi:MAG: serine hydrolase [Nitrospirae bacterium]|nr:serine hydrolase [Nitrospirota bacterium]